MVMIGCVVIQLLLYTISGFMEAFTRFNLYFAVDIMLTLSLVSILPLTAREVTRT